LDLQQETSEDAFAAYILAKERTKKKEGVGKKKTLTDDMNPQNPIRLLLTQKLHKPFRIQIRLGPRISREREFANAVFDPASFELLFCSADPGYFGVGVYDGRDGGVVYVSAGGC